MPLHEELGMKMVWLAAADGKLFIGLHREREIGSQISIDLKFDLSRKKKEEQIQINCGTTEFVYPLKPEKVSH